MGVAGIKGLLLRLLLLPVRVRIRASYNSKTLLSSHHARISAGRDLHVLKAAV